MHNNKRGCCVVYRDEDGDLAFEDEYTWEDACNAQENLLKTVFKDGKLTREQSLKEIRDILHGGAF